MLATLKESISLPGRMICLLHPWQDPVPFRRVWCLYELYTGTGCTRPCASISVLLTDRAACIPIPHSFHARGADHLLVPSLRCRGLLLEAGRSRRDGGAGADDRGEGGSGHG